MIPMPDDYTVRLVHMPVEQGGMMCEDVDGHVNFYINARLSSTGQMNAAAHEYKHWLNDDLRNGKDIRIVEDEKPLPAVFRAKQLLPGGIRNSAHEWRDDVIHTMGTYDDM